MKKLIHLFLIGSLLSIGVTADQIDHLKDPAALNPKNWIYLDQNWNEKDREWFYFIDQGSRMIPYRLFIHLEQADNNNLFKDPLNMLSYGFMSYPKNKVNPDELPVGFSRNDDYLGLTCAACHSQQLKYKDKFIRIDGGQSMLDLPGFLIDIEKAMAATWNDPEKYQRFETRALGNSPSATAKNLLKEEFEKYYQRRKEGNRRNHTEVAHGYSRLDAFGAILNKGLFLTGVKDNFNPPDAPASYPYIWDTPQHDYVEWNGSQSNSDIGALARNIGEVIGVFGDVDITPTKFLYFLDGGYRSSIQTSNLRKIEKKVSTLYSPLWPNSFPPIDQNKVKQGRELFENHCLSCHEDIDRTDPRRYIKVRMSTLGHIRTDPWMAKNAIELRGKTGIFEGKPLYYSAGEPMKGEEPALHVINNVMAGVLTNNPLQSLLAKWDSESLGHPKGYHPPKYVDGAIIEKGQETSKTALLAYKARPLNGIWATAPYLHNGSVPNLYELLLPAEQRSKSFYIGAWEYDPIKVGYVSDQKAGSFYFDTSLKGNSNAGHEYATGKDGTPALAEQEIRALLEYLKTL